MSRWGMIFIPFLILFHSLQSDAQFFRLQTFPFILPNNCSNLEYFETMNMSCVSCGTNRISTEDRTNCQCNNGFQAISFSSNGPFCEQCPRGRRIMGGKCVDCPENECFSCNDEEIWNSTISRCVQCPYGFERSEDKLSCKKCEDFKCLCSGAQCKSTIDVSSLNFNIKGPDAISFTSFYLESQMPNVAIRCANGSTTDCQALMNMCVLQNFDRDMSSACNVVDQIRRLNNWQSADQLFVAGDADSELNKEVAITYRYKMNPADILDIYLAIYFPNGTLKGIMSIHESGIFLCREDKISTSPLSFGQKLRANCKMRVKDFISSETRVLIEPFLKFRDEVGQMRMYPLAVRNDLIRSNDILVNRQSRDSNRWILTRRFFLIDDFSVSTKNSTLKIRYASKIHISVTMQPSRDGSIFPPYFDIQYDETRDLNDFVSVNFSINYLAQPARHDRDLEIAMAVLAPVSIIWAALRAYSWGRRNGKQLLGDATTVIQFLLYSASALGDVFLLVTTATVFWITFCYKSQSEVFYSIPDENQENTLFIYLLVALILKIAALIKKHIELIFQETFFIDWERPTVVENPVSGRPVSSDVSKERHERPVVVWRTYLIANEWNELRNYRSTSISLQMMLILFTLEYLGWKNFALVTNGFSTSLLFPSGVRILLETDPSSAYLQTSLTTEFAVVMCTYLVIALFQWIIQVLFIERILKDPFHNFIDLCSVSNISVLSLTHSLYGYYIHGRSPHGKADTDMQQMNEFLQIEKDNLCGFRGLEISSELQTYSVALPFAFRQHWNGATLTTTRHTLSDHVTNHVNNVAAAHSQMNTFLQEMIDHQAVNVDYVIRNKTFIESLLDIETVDASTVGQFTRDVSEMAFSRCFVYGNEWPHLSLEVSLFCVLYLLLGSVPFSCGLVYIVSKTIKIITSFFGTNHLTKTSLVDSRFFI